MRTHHSGKKIPSIYLNDFTDLDLFFFFYFILTFSLTNASLSFQLRKAYAVLWTANRFVGSETSKTMILSNFENLNPISNIFQETRDFLVLTETIINYLYLFKNNDRHFRDQVERPSSHLKVTKMWFGPKSKEIPFGTLLWGFLPPGKHLLFYFHFLFFSRTMAIDPLSANHTKWSNTLKQFVGKNRRGWRLRC